MLPVKHLSAGSLSLAQVCAEKWRQRYVLGQTSPPVSAMLVGSAFHHAIEDYYLYRIKGKEPSEADVRELYDLHWRKELLDRAGDTVFWLNEQEYEYDRGMRAVTCYYPVAQRILPTHTEQEFYYDVEGVPLPIKGYIDVETDRSIVDTKTSSRPCSLKPEWRMQDRIYKMVSGKDALWHVVVINKEKNYVITEKEDNRLVSLYSEHEAEMTRELIRRIYGRLLWNAETYGFDNPWEGAISSKSACGDCGFRSICPWWAKGATNETDD